VEWQGFPVAKMTSNGHSRPSTMTVRLVVHERLRTIIPW